MCPAARYSDALRVHSCPGPPSVGIERGRWVSVSLECVQLCLRRKGLSSGNVTEHQVYFLPPHPSLQDFHSLATYLSQNTSSVFLDTISDFHLLLFLVTNEVMPLQVRTELACPLSTWRGWPQVGLGTGPSFPPGTREVVAVPLTSCGQWLCTRGLLIERGIFHIKCRPSVMGLISLEGSNREGRSGGSSVCPIVGQQRPQESPVLIASDPQPCFPMSPLFPNQLLSPGLGAARPECTAAQLASVRPWRGGGRVHRRRLLLGRGQPGSIQPGGRGMCHGMDGLSFCPRSHRRERNRFFLSP